MLDLRDPVVLETLLGRRVRRLLTVADRRVFAGQRVLITGAGGSVGSELARAIAACRPEGLTLVDHSEYNLFSLEREIGERWPGVPLRAWLGDVTRRRSMRAICGLARPHVVYHAAAYKHVTMVERAVCAAVEVNVIGTLNVAGAAAAAGARFVLISSDKAAEPRSVMGATKRLAELVTIVRARGPFRPLVVRFGNILGSSGSVLEIMLERIRLKQPIPITHPKATRYFMSGAEAAALVLKTDLVGEPGAIHWLDMGAPVNILELARRLLAMAATDEAVPIQVIGLRPGEKLREDLTSQGLALQRTDHRSIWVARQPVIDGPALTRVVRALREDILRQDDFAALNDLQAAVPGFEPSQSAWVAAAASAMGGVTRGPYWKQAGRSA